MNHKIVQGFEKLSVVPALVAAPRPRCREHPQYNRPILFRHGREHGRSSKNRLPKSQRKSDLGIPLPYTWLNPSTRPRTNAIQQSLAITKGKVTEHIVPYFPGFDLDPKDIRFLGTPIDLIAFNGLNTAEEVEIVFIEVKTGRSVLSAREKAVKKAVEEKRVSWRVFNPDVEAGRPLARV